MRMLNFFLIVVFISAVPGCLVSCRHGNQQSNSNPYNLALVQTVEEYKQQVAGNPEMKLVDLEEEVQNIRLDIRYATRNNFTHEVIYPAAKAYARKPVAEALKKVQDSLSVYHLGLKIYDAYRPYSATLRFYEVYPDTNFVANPKYGSRHNRGCAIDLTLVELASGNEIPMPTAFDDFTPKAHPGYTALPDTVLKNRAFLFSVMEFFGFTHYPTEWWHFDFNGWEKFPLTGLPFDKLEAARN